MLNWMVFTHPVTLHLTQTAGIQLPFEKEVGSHAFEPSFQDEPPREIFSLKISVCQAFIVCVVQQTVDRI